MIKVFVYGTLKRGFPFFELGLADATYFGPVQTTKPYPMFIAADFYGPMMLDSPGEGLRITGELYEVETLDKLDELEDVAKPGSYRTKIDVEPLGGGVPVEAIGYMKTREWLKPLHSDCIADYQDRRFIPPWERD
ncbi:gamma-glutamylcyclotransferase family protein [Tianweitania sp.]|uniref:gamma-glutamylcyclotransferase family protein n=1 Tax=Tianweitania sp. TaxID=2021634 RepID=UPI00289C6CF5|nr:gamma-glutamylcyclotransferase family protein [Tianweitania sp.]